MNKNNTLFIFVIFLIIITNYTDRYVISIFLNDIGKDLNLSDMQLGLLGGLPFAVLFALVGIPFARIADVSNRRNIIVLATITWSLATLFCGLAGSFAMLFFFRTLVGIGEGAGTPAIHSMIADRFGAKRGAGPASLFGLGSATGAFLGLAVGGVLAEQFGWRVGFIFIGLPGVLVAFLAWKMIKETRTRTHIPSMSETLGTAAGGAIVKLLRVRSFALLLIGMTALYFSQMGMAQWLPAFFARSFGSGTGEIGVIMGVIVGIASGIGSVTGGLLGNRLAQRNVAWLLYLPALCCVVSLPMFIGTLTLDIQWLAYVLYAGGSVTNGMLAGPTFAAMYGLSKANERATAVAVVALSTNIIGFGLGPLFAGVISDYLRPAYGVESLRYALLMLASVMGLAAVLFYFGARGLRRDWRPDEDMDPGPALVGRTSTNR